MIPDMVDAEAPPRRQRSGWLLRLAFAGVAVLFLFSAVAAGQRFSLAAQVLLAPIPTLAPPDAIPTAVATEATIWDRHGPVNVLLIGGDKGRAGGCRGGGYHLTDTMILARFEPSTGKAGLMSIPRDLYVPMPGRPARKITVAYAMAEGEEEGTGADYLRRTIEQNLELPVHRYIMIDIAGFERVIDELGGVEIDVPPSSWDPDVGLYDAEYPTDDCGTMELEFKPGLQVMDGTQAVQYARSRHTTSDFDRSRRQIDVLMAIRNKALSPAFLRRAPGLLPALLDTVQTDFTTREILSLARPALKADPESIARYSIDSRLVYNDRILIDGVDQSVLRLNSSAYELLRPSFLALTEPAYPSDAASGPVERLAQPEETPGPLADATPQVTTPPPTP